MLGILPAVLSGCYFPLFFRMGGRGGGGGARGQSDMGRILCSIDLKNEKKNVFSLII